MPDRAQHVRGIALELERLANHLGDLGAIAGDIAYQPGAAFFGRLRGECLNLLMTITGNRYGRGLIRPAETGEPPEFTAARQGPDEARLHAGVVLNDGRPAAGDGVTRLRRHPTERSDDGERLPHLQRTLKPSEGGKIPQQCATRSDAPPRQCRL